jgi:hypothetical protein
MVRPVRGIARRADATSGGSLTGRLGMRKRVELQEEADHIGVWPDASGDDDR